MRSTKNSRKSINIILRRGGDFMNFEFVDEREYYLDYQLIRDKSTGLFGVYRYKKGIVVPLSPTRMLRCMS
jgi:hypothetical protein